MAILLKVIFSSVFFAHASVRKGVKAHKGILKAYMDGMDVKDADRFILLDLIPNRLGYLSFICHQFVMMLVLLLKLSLVVSYVETILRDVSVRGKARRIRPRCCGDQL